MHRMTLDELRQHLNGLDRRLLELISERQITSREIARVKRATGYPTRDYAREREVILAVRSSAAELGVPADVAEAVMRVLIRSSLTTQEQASVAARGAGSGQRALVIGGAGKIGAWFAQFLASQGFAVEIADPAGGTGALKDLRSSPLDHDFIVVATPLAATNQILTALAERRPGSVIFDVGSVKTPLRGGLEALREAGLRVTSIHPMFGPSTELLSGRHVIFIDLGAGDALARARALFAPTMVEQVVMSLDEHDRLIAYVLGLSHAVNIAFFTALAGSGETAPRLVQMSSTTFDSQFDIASAVAQESPELYFEIQRSNDYGAESLDALAQAVGALRAAVQAGDQARFTALMDAGREYTQGRQSVRQRRA
jgi:chorismate mutase/prephenate dehydrogenase